LRLVPLVRPEIEISFRNRKADRRKRKKAKNVTNLNKFDEI